MAGTGRNEVFHQRTAAVHSVEPMLLTLNANRWQKVLQLHFSCLQEPTNDSVIVKLLDHSAGMKNLGRLLSERRVIP